MRKLSLVLLAFCFVTACGGGGGSSTSSITADITTPANTSDVAVDTDIVVTLTDTDNIGVDGDVDWDTVLTLKATGDTTNLCTEITYDDTTKLITCTPTSNLAAATQYTALLTGLSDANGKIIANASKTFLTASAATPLTVTVTDAADSEIEATGSINIWPTTFTATFSKAIEATTFTDTNVTLTCAIPDGNTTPQPTVTIGASPCTDAVCTFSVEDAWKYALLHCTLTLTTGIEATDGTTLATDATFKFLNDCAVNDDFNADSGSCWTNVYKGVPPVAGSWSDITDIVTFEIENSSLDFDTASKSSAFFSKTEAFASSGFSMTYHVDSISGINASDDPPGPTSSRAGFLANVGSNPNTSTTSLFVGFFDFAGTQTCVVAVNGGGAAGKNATANCPSGHSYSVIASVDSSGNVTATYQTDGADPVALSGAITTKAAPASYTHLIHAYYKNADTATSVVTGSITTSGVTSTEQY